MSSFSKIFCFLLVLGFALPATAQTGQNQGVGVDYETRLGDVENQMRILTGSIEQIDYAVRRLDKVIGRLQTDYETRLSDLEKAQKQHAEAVAQPADNNLVSASPEGRLGSLKMRDGKVTAAVNDPDAPSLPDTPDDYGLTTQEQYDRAFSLLRQANYDDAEIAFKNFIDKNPGDKLIENALYWYAETFYVRGKFRQAAVGFLEAFQHGPKGSKAPDSLLKMGMSLGALKENDDACTTLSSLLSEYPKAPKSILSRAKQERKRLKCSK